MLKYTTKFETGRLAGLSDGVFSICVTLLVLDLKLPESPDVSLAAAIGANIHKVESWVLSFVIIGALWVMQHNIIAHLRATDAVLLWLNLLFLMPISLMPWTTDLTGDYLHEPLAIVIFSGTLGLAGLVLMYMWVYACRGERLISPEIDERTEKVITILAARVPVVSLISIALAFVHRSLALWSWLLVLASGAVVRYRHRSTVRGASQGPRPPDLEHRTDQPGLDPERGPVSQ
jgi:uncharacterized membrane protein